MDAEGRKRQVVELLKGTETGDAKRVAAIAPKKYIQHSPGLGDGVEGLSRLVGMVAAPRAHKLGEEAQRSRLSSQVRRGDSYVALRIADGLNTRDRPAGGYINSVATKAHQIGVFEPAPIIWVTLS